VRRGGILNDRLCGAIGSTPYAEMLTSNIGLVSGVDVGAWFSREGVGVPGAYQARFDAAVNGG
jgi:hypothetical protein